MFLEFIVIKLFVININLSIKDAFTQAIPVFRLSGREVGHSLHILAVLDNHNSIDILAILDNKNSFYILAILENKNSLDILAILDNKNSLDILTILDNKN